MVDSEECKKALRAFAVALASYLRRNARRTISIASIVGQDRVKISVRALMREHDPSTGFFRFMDVLGTIRRCGEDLLESRGFKMLIVDGEIYFEVGLELLKKLIDMKLDDLISFFT